MTTLVRSRPFRQKNTNNIRRQIRKIKLIYPSINFSIKWLWIFVLFIIFSYWIFFIIKHTIFQDKNYIEKIYYSQVSVDNYDNPHLYKKISELIKNENYFVVSKLRKWFILNILQNEFPMVRNIKIIQPSKFAASVRVEFYYPDFVVNLEEKKFWVLWDYDFEIFSGNKIGDSIFSIDLPKYVTWIDSLHWLFFEISPEKLMYDMDIISQWFTWYSRIVYLPWSSMTLVFIWDKKIYLNNKNSLTWQIDNYELLMKYYNEANSLKIIDLGSLEWNKIIVRK